jgi:hypothetical protein
MNNYTPLAISGNDKNKQLTLLTQRKLAFTARIPFLRYTVKSLEHLKNPLYMPKTNHTVYVIESQIYLVRQSLSRKNG